MFRKRESGQKMEEIYLESDEREGQMPNHRAPPPSILPRGPRLGLFTDYTTPSTSTPDYYLGLSYDGLDPVCDCSADGKTPLSPSKALTLSTVFILSDDSIRK